MAHLAAGLVVARHFAPLLVLVTAAGIGLLTQSVSVAGLYVVLAISGWLMILLAQLIGRVIGAAIPPSDIVLTLTELAGYVAFSAASVSYGVIALDLAGIATLDIEWFTPLGWTTLGLYALYGLGHRSKVAVQAAIRLERMRALEATSPPEPSLAPHVEGQSASELAADLVRAPLTDEERREARERFLRGLSATRLKRQADGDASQRSRITFRAKGTSSSGSDQVRACRNCGTVLPGQASLCANCGWMNT